MHANPITVQLGSSSRTQFTQGESGIMIKNNNWVGVCFFAGLNRLKQLGSEKFDSIYPGSGKERAAQSQEPIDMLRCREPELAPATKGLKSI